MEFPLIFLIGRPAAGKSEVIRYLKGLSREERKRRLHISDFYELDDFPMLWAWFEEDAFLQQMGKPRLHTKDDGSFSHTYLWDLLIKRLDLDYRKRKAEPEYADNTAIVEFSRGVQHGGFNRVFMHFSDETLQAGAVLYIDVSYEESLRKNRKRFNPDKPYSILEHGLSDERLEQLYKDSDWAELASGDPGFISVRGIRMPYSVLKNDDDVTTLGGERLGERLEQCFNELTGLMQKR